MDAAAAAAAATTTKRKRPAASDAATTADEVSDAEVEEFYAILRRMRDATRRLCPGAGARPPPRAPAWKPSFSWEDFADPQKLPPPQPDERVAENATPPRPGLDLNEPPPDAPAAPSCSARAPA
ncbi:hypothetical protein GUJ93_ZPchr0001g30493 [Zizania palustris]|uniref:NPR1 interactor n=1 Tax=Zizania palustris TaxID=103762 RepID=A0A8J5RSP7_ZIZPA|nr:hypothetical protein GUJ93_ZPchr0001g30493 [Zizania palustris]